MAGEVLSAVSRLLGAFFMAGGAVKIHDGGTGIYKIAHDQIYTVASAEWPLQALGWALAPTDYMKLITCLELAGGLCLLAGRSPKTKRRGILMLLPVHLLSLHAFFPTKHPEKIGLFLSVGVGLMVLIYLYRGYSEKSKDPPKED